ncbi:MAG: IS3 family transposase [Planctomycetota bacterium]
MEAEKAKLPVAVMCRALGVSRSGYYSFKADPNGKRAARDSVLLTHIRRIHKESRGTYGSPRVHAQLLREGISAGKHSVARVMRSHEITWKARRAYKSTTQSRHDLAIPDNILNREFSVESKDSVWCADITPIRTKRGWVYLAAIIDLATRLIVGWKMDSYMRSDLVESALKNALAWREPAQDLIHHSDRGRQYASFSYQSLLLKHGIRCSMSRIGDCWDNAVMESFFGTYKQELQHHAKWENLAEARAATMEYIEIFYNRKRLHSTLGYRTPREVDEAAK